MNNDWIKKYFDGVLSSRERNSFEQQMEEDALLEESVSGLEAWLDSSAQNNLSGLETSLNDKIRK